jgi:DNA-binding protein HU-beta
MPPMFARSYPKGRTQRGQHHYLARGKVQLPGFGKFYVREQRAREGKNPQTGERMQIEARKVPAFKAGKTLKESV